MRPHRAQLSISATTSHPDHFFPHNVRSGSRIDVACTRPPARGVIVVYSMDIPKGDTLGECVLPYVIYGTMSE